VKPLRTVLVLGAAIIAAIAVGLFASPALRAPEYASDKKFDVSGANVDVRVQPDATLRITEQLNFRFSDHSFTGAYRDIAVQPGAELSGFAVADDAFNGNYEPGASASLGSYGTPHSFGTELIDQGNSRTQRIVWHYEQTGGNRLFTLKYAATKVAEAYDDVVFVHWAIWGDQWQFPLSRLLGSIKLVDPASGNGRPIKAWLEPARLGTTPTITPGGAAVVDVTKAPEGHQVVLSAVFPRAAFRSVAGATVIPGDGLAKITKQQDALAHTTGGSLVNWIWRHSGWIALLIVLVVLGLTIYLVRRGREVKDGSDGYVSEPPEDLSPAEAYGIANEGGYSDRAVIATLLDLGDRGFYTLNTGAGATEGRDDRLELVLAVAPRDDAKVEALQPHEQSVLAFFDELIGTEPAGLEDLKDRVPKHDAEWRGRWTSMNAALRIAGDQDLLWDRDLRAARIWLIVGSAVTFGGLAAFTWMRADELHAAAIGFIAAAAIALLPTSNALRRLDPASRERQLKWSGFARWTKDFPSLSDDPPATLLLWKRILIYGVVFGTAAKVIESGRIPAAVMQQASSSGTAWWGYNNAGTSALFFAGGSNFASDFSSDFSSQVASQSSSGGGGGGGGSSGGGGGGAW
jgi:uncharacterized membrane protein